MWGKKAKGVLATVFLMVLVGVFSLGGLKADAAEETTIKKLNTLERPTWILNTGVTKGVDHDRQDLGVVLPKNATIEIRQTNTNFTEQLVLELLNDDQKTEQSYKIGSSWVKVTASVESVPFIRTTFTKEAPTVEYRVSADAKDLPVFKQGDNETNFFQKWDANNSAFGLISNQYIQILVPTTDKAYLKKMNDFSSINDLFAYYDTMFETYNELEGVSATPENITDKNIPNRYFAKADKNGWGSAYYSEIYTAETAPSVAEFWLKPDWGGLHEIGHGYAGKFVNDSTFTTGEVWNNIYADTMQQRMYGDDYTAKSWLYDGNVPYREGRFENDVYVTKTPLQEWDLADKLYMIVLMKDKAGDPSFTHFNQAYRTATDKGKISIDDLTLDLVSKYYGETSKYNFTPFIELVRGTMTEKQKEDNLNSGNKAVYPLASLLSGNNLQTARKDIKLNSKWGLVSNSQLSKYKVTKTMNLQLEIANFEQISGKVLVIKDGSEVIRKIKLVSPTITLENMPIGIYSLEIPTGTSRYYEPSTNYLAVSDQTNNAVITMNELKTSSIGEEEFQFKGLGDELFMTATVDTENESLKVNIKNTSPHPYFSSDYASIEVLDEQGQSVFKKVINGKVAIIERLETVIKPNYKIKIMHKEPSRLSIINAPDNLIDTSATNQTFTVTKYGLANTSTDFTAQDALTNYKANLVALGTDIRNNATLRSANYSISKTRLEKGISYLPDTDPDKSKYQEEYADLFIVRDEPVRNLLDGQQLEFQMNGLGEWEFADLDVDLNTNIATIKQNAGEPHWYFQGTYASIRISDTNDQEVFNKEFTGRGYAPASEQNVKIAPGYFITVTHQEAFADRLIIVNEDSEKSGFQLEQSVMYIVTPDGLKKVNHTKPQANNT
ncbi:enhancing factor (viral) [Listeria ivanovii]|uniref:putative mucin/carbohydrate-binding domain-containing protein n=2 Tax=Listeria ivanovii TaxID=1638 RepID=UPI000DA7D8C7|nr:putative mucin/carbohydrate-binding domain-containing protein [Listeria ivanovii]PZF90881.1 enhancing factor (viral) [Listeria ivanovii]PZF96604.1 enhancing factor (viral) [Listeria ivanovii]PZG06715.1 enhancing factor (viral) [Listeria ivanovii]PZG11654.1 enhancing factor (viral) [Listeria ivanovii]PZG28467.1 enhancing factor (viral) [Listeria ivanovii]